MVQLHVAVHQREIRLVYLPPREHLAKLLMGRIIPRDDDQPAGLLVEAMHDAGAQVPSRRRQLAVMAEQRIHQSAAIARILCRP